MTKIKMTTYIIQSLKDENVSHIFLVPGGYVDNFLHDMVCVEGITPIACASEGGAAMMADGFARASENFGVCLGISGPGSTNMITGLSLSCVDQTPVLAISGDPPLTWRNRDAIQDPGSQGLKTTALFRHITKAQYLVYEAGLIGDYMRRCQSKLKALSPGVVHLSVPMDLQARELEYDYQPMKSSIGNSSRLADFEALNSVMELISSNTKTVLLIGMGVRVSKATDTLIAFAERYDVPVATTISAKGDFPEDHRLSLGVFGWAGSQLANETLMSEEIECLVVVGSKMGQIATMCWSEQLRSDRKLVQIDINSEHLNQTYLADIAVTSDARAAFEYFVNLERDFPSVASTLEKASVRRDWLATIREKRQIYYDAENRQSDKTPIHPARIITELGSCMPSDTQLFVDNGAHTFFAMHYWQALKANHYFSAIKYSGAMGWAIPASIGAKFSRPDKVTVAVVGDGCMLMEGIEIQTAARYKLKNMIFVVINNKAHGNPKLRTGGFESGEEDELTNIVDHNWASFAQSLGLQGFTVKEPKELASTFESALEADTSVLIDVKCGLYPTPTKVFDATFMREFNQYIGDLG